MYSIFKLKICKDTFRSLTPGAMFGCYGTDDDDHDLHAPEWKRDTEKACSVQKFRRNFREPTFYARDRCSVRVRQPWRAKDPVHARGAPCLTQWRRRTVASLRCLSRARRALIKLPTRRLVCPKCRQTWGGGGGARQTSRKI
jgi:hypothetical protein